MAIRIHNATGSSDIANTAKGKLRLTFRIVFVCLTLCLIIWSTAILVSARQPNSLGYAFNSSYCTVLDAVGIIFLVQVILMSLLVAWLFVETHRVVVRERKAKQGGFATQTLHKERCTYAVVSTFFALSYVVRLVFNVYGNTCGDDPWPSYPAYIVETTCFLIEGTSMGVLMYFHFANFREGGLFSSTDEEEFAQVTIMPHEYHRFDTASVEADRLDNRISFEYEESEQDCGLKNRNSLNGEINKLLNSTQLVLNSSKCSNLDDSVSREQNEE